MTEQSGLFDFLDSVPGEGVRMSGREAGRQALDQLFSRISQYRNSREYFEMMQFIARLPIYAPFNMFLLYTQNPKISYVATANSWKRRFRREVRKGARSLVILAPMSPVLFVYDLVDTDGPEVPNDILNPFRTSGTIKETVWDNTLFNCGINGIAVMEQSMAHTHAGSCRRINDYSHLFENDLPEQRFEIFLKDSFTIEEKYATLAHEIGHILAGHLGPVKSLKIADRGKLFKSEVEMEAESISYLVCQRQGLETTSAEYLAGYAKQNVQLPEFSLDIVLHVAGAIETWDRKKLPIKKLSDSPERENDIINQ